jgi:pyridinium-3,5-biscarboxylic acid mononucleotide sulfurtransferase
LSRRMAAAPAVRGPTGARTGRYGAMKDITRKTPVLPDDPVKNGELDKKIAEARKILARLGRVVVAFSGGVDSTLLLSLAADTLGSENVLAAVGISPSLPDGEREEARRLAETAGVELVEFESREFDDPNFTRNPVDRCYHCKSALFAHIWTIARERGFTSVICGANADDPGDYRPGLDAGMRAGVVNPLMEAGLTKADIRAVSRIMGLVTWDKPAMACLASRIPYDSPITPERLARVGRAEEALRKLGFGECRVRDYETLARIEVPRDSLNRAVLEREAIVSSLRALGYVYVTLDLAGLRSGSMNEILR